MASLGIAVAITNLVDLVCAAVINRTVPLSAAVKDTDPEGVVLIFAYIA